METDSVEQPQAISVEQPEVISAQQQSLTNSQSNKIEIVPNQLWKIIHQEGAGQTPKKGQQVFALYKGTLENGVEFDSNQDRENPFKFNLGSGQVIKGWDEGFASMKKGERATLICSPEYAYGKKGSPPRIPPNSTLHFEVQLLDFQDQQRTKFQMTEQQKIAEATKAKNQGNQAFKNGNYQEATHHYKKGIDLIEDEEGNNFQQLLKVLRLNAAQSQIKQKNYSQAITNCTKVLEKDTNNVKALYRRGHSYLKNQQFGLAQTDFQNLLKIDPSNVQAQKQLQNVKIAEKAYRHKEKKVFGNMFSKPLTEEKINQEPKKQSIEKENQSKKTE